MTFKSNAFHNLIIYSKLETIDFIELEDTYNDEKRSAGKLSMTLHGDVNTALARPLDNQLVLCLEG